MVLRGSADVCTSEDGPKKQRVGDNNAMQLDGSSAAASSDVGRVGFSGLAAAPTPPGPFPGPLADISPPGPLPPAPTLASLSGSLGCGLPNPELLGSFPGSGAENSPLSSTRGGHMDMDYKLANQRVHGSPPRRLGR